MKRFQMIAAASGLVLVAGSLRSPISSLGAVLPDVQQGLGLSPSIAGMLTALPLVVFGVVGSAVPGLLRRVATHRALVGASVLVAIGTAARGLGSFPWLLAGTVAALAGIAVANVLLPAFVHAVSLRNAGWLTGAVVSAMQVGTAAAAFVAVPLSVLAGSWTFALAVWGIPALLGLLTWSFVDLGHLADRVDVTSSEIWPSRTLLRDGVAWALLGVFAIQASVAYVLMGWLPSILRDAGMSPQGAGGMVALAWSVSIPASLLLPSWLARRADQRDFVWFVAVPWSTAIVGLLTVPVEFAVGWSLLLGLGLASFAVALLLITLRSPTPDVARRVSAFAQGGGYLVAFVVTSLFGVLRDLTGGWTASLLLLLVPQSLLVVLGRHAASGQVAGRP